ncbi:MAG: bifunctional phosphoglucose/phosphomannose isomerase [Acidimicrobiia bacterium]|nr:bifunctional phosphoglucose/phosphomannose isomerase [Acidimicrobiia bacterium]
MSGRAGALDSLDVLGELGAVPDRMTAVAAALVGGVEGLPDPADIDQLLILASGAGAVAAEVMRAAASAQSPVPIVVHEHRELPGFVNRRTLVLAVGTTDTDDVLLDAMGEAEHAGAHMVVIAPDGSLAEMADHWHAPRCRLGGAATADASAFEALAAMVAVTAQAQLFSSGVADLDDAIAQLRLRLAKLEADATAVELLARHIGRSFPLIQGGGELGAAAARWWKRSVNVMAKAPSWSSTIPSACYDEVAGWGQHGDVTRQVFQLVVLRHLLEHPQLTVSYPVLDGWQLEVVGGMHDVWAEGGSALAQGADLMMQGSRLAWQLAADAGVDPGPTPAVDAMVATLRG